MTEFEQLKSLTKNQKRYLARHICGWCEMPLHKTYCGDSELPCSEEVRMKRREDCLKLHNSRKPKAAIENDNT